MDLYDWLKDRKIKFEQIEEDLIEIKGFDKRFYIIPDKDILIVKDLRLNTERTGSNFIFKWGGLWYYELSDYESISFQLLQDIGELNQEKSFDDLPFLGIHSSFELYNGAGIYKDWIQKIKFLGYSSTAIVEKNTLSGVLKFQSECKKNDIKSIIGEEISVQWGDEKFHLKLYVKNEIGWKNLLSIHKFIKVDNEREFISKEQLLSCSLKGLILVIDKDVLLTDQILIDFKNHISENDLYYQWDTTEYVNDTRDFEFLSKQKSNLKFVSKGKIKAALINDAYYINDYESTIKKKLNELNPKKEIYDVAKNQYIKNIDDNVKLMNPLFGKINKEDYDEFISTICLNAGEIGRKCNFTYEGRRDRLPQFKKHHLPHLKDLSHEDLFWDLIERGLSERKIQGDIYFERLKTEAEVIKRGGFVDYFLILWDLIRFAETKNILIGLGRGSAGGSLIAYLLKLTNIDPIKYGLLFERFLNEGRLESGELPDIDTDIAGERRYELKKYLEEIYGEHQVCSVGTYGTYQLAAGIKDILRSSVKHQYLNSIIKRLNLTSGDDFSIVFQKALENKAFKDLIKDRVYDINQLKTIHKGTKNNSIHAAAVIIVPEDQGTVYDQLPVKLDGDLLVSEWEGEDLANMGFLKEDLLGTNQLNKFSKMLSLIEKMYDEKVDFYNIPLDDEVVYEYYKKGWNSDNFHFGSFLLTIYSKKFKPDNINDLIAMIALVRPGALEAGSADKYVKYKDGGAVPEIQPGLEEITKETYGLIIYQEQVMQICQRISSFTLVEADKIRKAVGKKKMDLIHSYQQKFIDGGIKNGYEKTYLEQLWKLLELHGSYSFNKAHSVAYAETGYRSQWFKVNYPLVFWIVAFEYAKDDQIANYMSEIEAINGDVKIVPVDINLSKDHFYADKETNEIYWSINKIRMVGESSLQAIEFTRQQKRFESFDDFIQRLVIDSERGLPKNRIENLIYAGAFDKIEKIDRIQDRALVFGKLRRILGLKLNEISFFKEDQSLVEKDWWWLKKQREISKFAYFDFYDLLKRYIPNFIIHKTKFATSKEILGGNKVGKSILTGGLLIEIIEKKSKNGPMAVLIMNHNFDKIEITLWNEQWVKMRDKLLGKEGSIILISGKGVFDKWKQSPTIWGTQNTILKVL